MAKNSDQRAGGFEAENTGGVLSGLLAEEEHLDRRAMFRLATWGVVAVGAVVVAVLANQSGMKLRRDEIAALDLTRQSQQIQSVAKESQNETRRLASAIDTLNSDRDRMYSRLTSLEQGLESVTGAIAKQNAAALARGLIACRNTACRNTCSRAAACRAKYCARTCAGHRSGDDGRSRRADHRKIAERQVAGREQEIDASTRGPRRSRNARAFEYAGGDFGDAADGFEIDDGATGSRRRQIGRA